VRVERPERLAVRVDDAARHEGAAPRRQVDRAEDLAPAQEREPEREERVVDVELRLRPGRARDEARPDRRLELVRGEGVALEVRQHRRVADEGLAVALEVEVEAVDRGARGDLAEEVAERDGPQPVVVEAAPVPRRRVAHEAEDVARPAPGPEVLERPGRRLGPRPPVPADHQGPHRRDVPGLEVGHAQLVGVLDGKVDDLAHGARRRERGGDAPSHDSLSLSH